MVLATMGYEGLETDSFFSILQENNITTIVDVRELPISRKAGFSKSSLSEMASFIGIDYVHFKALGCPREIRHDYRIDQDWSKYSHRYLAYLKTQSKEIMRLAELVETQNCCLLCFEANHSRCHRSFVADAVAQIAGDILNIIHLEKVPT